MCQVYCVAGNEPGSIIHCCISSVMVKVDFDGEGSTLVPH